MELALKLASLATGERKMLKEKEEILKREDLTNKEKVGLVGLLEKKHQIKAYRLLIKVCHISLKVIQFFSVGAVMIGLCFLGAESKVLGMNIIAGLFMFVFALLGYAMYNRVSDEIYFYRIKLKEVKKWVKAQKSRK